MTGKRQVARAAMAAVAMAFGGVGAEAGELTASPPLETRAEEVAGLFHGTPGGYHVYFTPGFLKAVPPAQLDAIVSQYFTKYGGVTRTRRLAGGDTWHGTFEYVFAKGYTVKADLAIAEQPPHLVSGLLLGHATPQAPTLAAVAKGFEELPGQSTFAATRLGPRGPELKASHAADRALAIGSVFKLWILGALLEDIASGKRRWDEVVALTAEARSLPSGALHTWPENAPVTVHTLASLMISQSDNTATDALLLLVGRTRVEAAVASMGVRDAARNRPMMRTLEMFKLKAGDVPDAIATWARLGETDRRKYLRDHVAPMDRDAVKAWTEPRALDTLEWFASANDMGRMLAWLRDHSSMGEAEKVRGVLAINPVLKPEGDAWPYIGFKGGSEPGVVAAAFLLRAKDGTWWTLTAAWNDPAAEVDHEKFFGLIERAAVLMGAPN